MSAVLSSGSPSELRDDVYGGLPDSDGRSDTDDDHRARYVQLLSPAGSSSGDVQTARLRQHEHQHRHQHHHQQEQQQQQRQYSGQHSNGRHAAGAGTTAAAAAGDGTPLTAHAESAYYHHNNNNNNNNNNNRHEDIESANIACLRRREDQSIRPSLAAVVDCYIR